MHEARKAVTKTRALLRLPRAGMPRAECRGRMRALRDTGRLLSGSRDADVLVLGLDELLARGEQPPIPAPELRALRHDVARSRRREGRRSSEGRRAVMRRAFHLCGGIHAAWRVVVYRVALAHPAPRRRPQRFPRG